MSTKRLENLAPALSAAPLLVLGPLPRQVNHPQTFDTTVTLDKGCCWNRKAFALVRHPCLRQMRLFDRQFHTKRKGRRVLDLWPVGAPNSTRYVSSALLSGES